MHAYILKFMFKYQTVQISFIRQLHKNLQEIGFSVTFKIMKKKHFFNEIKCEMKPNLLKHYS